MQSSRLRRNPAMVAAILLAVAPLLGQSPSGTPAVPSASPETQYGTARPETSYAAAAAALQLPASYAPGVVTTSESRYNPAGTTSTGTVALLSTRRSSTEWPGFLLGMQGAAIKQTGKALHVAPSTAVTIAEQLTALKGRTINTVLIDSPDADAAKEAVEAATALGFKAAVISEAMARTYSPAAVVVSPIYYGERTGEETIRQVGNNAVRVGYVLKAESLSEDVRKSTLDMFKKVFASVAPKVELVEVDPATYQPGFSKFDVVVVITPEDSAKFVGELRAKFPESKLIASGDGDVVRQAFEKRLIDIRLRTDYERVLSNAINESQRKSEFPIILRQAAEKR